MTNKISKIFVQVYELDMEGRNGTWCDTSDSYETAVKKIDAWNHAVRMIEKTFDPETFTITTKEIKRTEKVFNSCWWDGTVRETYKYAG